MRIIFTILQNKNVILYDSNSGAALDSTDITNTGYTFYNLKPGHYYMGVKTNRTPGGINATDALLISNIIVGSLSPKQLQRYAGETRSNNHTTSLDALN